MDQAWKERVSTEDKTLLEQTKAARAALQQGRGSATPTGSRGTPTITPSVRNQANESIRRTLVESNKNKVAAPVGTSIRSTRGGNAGGSDVGGSSVVPASIHSSRSTQPSHRAVSSAGGKTCTSVISELTNFTQRLDKMESRLDEERAERKQVHNELAEIKKLLLAQRSSKSSK